MSEKPKMERSPTEAEWQAAERKMSRRRGCSYCGQAGHNMRTCPERYKEKTHY